MTSTLQRHEAGPLHRRGAGSSATRLVRLLEAIPGLARVLAPEETADALLELVVPEISLAPGRWDPPAGGVPLLVRDGLLVRQSTVHGETSSQIAGPGDLFGPTARVAAPFVAADWHVLLPARALVLNATSVATLSRYPKVLCALLVRSATQSEFQAAQQAIANVKGIDAQLHLLLWAFARRWGHPVPEGLCLPWPLTHDVLARLLGARRPTISQAATRLARAGGIVRNADRTWTIAAEPALAGSRPAGT